MKLQPSARREVRRIAVGTGLCTGVMLAGFFLLRLLHIGIFDTSVILGAAGGYLVATGNFMLLCLTLQRAAQEGEQGQRNVVLQASYHGRLLLQAAWVTAAFLSGRIHVIAAALPLLFPKLILLHLRRRENASGNCSWRE